MSKYDDIINLPHYEPKNHARMSLYNRSAQFAPFSALSGYKDAINETSRIVDKKIILSEHEKAILDQELSLLIQNPKEITITYFIPDKSKNGGKYITITDYFKKIDYYQKEIILQSGKHILIENIVKIKE